MNLKTRKPLQIGAVSLALTMLASYVVHRSLTVVANNKSISGEMLA